MARLKLEFTLKEKIEESKAASRGSHKLDSPMANHYEAMALVDQYVRWERT